jgi:hypothetical protein
MLIAAATAPEFVIDIPNPEYAEPVAYNVASTPAPEQLPLL